MKTERFELKISPDDKAIIKRAAAMKGLSIASFVVKAAHSKAIAVLSRVKP